MIKQKLFATLIVFLVLMMVSIFTEQEKIDRTVQPSITSLGTNNQMTNIRTINPLSFLPTKPIINPLITNFSHKNNSPETAVVNIFCSVTEGEFIKNISSSGVLISYSGLILTNAHVGIHPFIENYSDQKISCKIRSGSPAHRMHAMSFIYISPDWTKKHKGEVGGIVSIDSGNSDFAILKASNPTDILKFTTPISIRNIGIINPLHIFSKNKLDRSFSPDLSIGQNITVIGYPIPNLDPDTLSKRQNRLSIKDLFLFSEDQGHERLGLYDLIETSASTIGKNGSSGGAIVDNAGYLIALIANVIPTQNPDLTYIRGITLDHIDTSLFSQTGLTLSDLIKSNGSSLQKIFEDDYLYSVKSDLLGE